MECFVCSEKCIDKNYLCNHEYEKSKEKCNFIACITCYKKYLLSSSKEPHCMACRTVIPFEKQLECFTKEWLFGKYKNHRENQLMQIEQQRFGQDLMKIENEKEIKKLEAEKDEIHKHYVKIINNIKNEMRLKTNEVNIKINEKRQIKKSKVKFNYNFQCPDKNCHGILNNDFLCVLCDKKTCKKCYTINIDEEMHTCDPEQIESFKKIKEEAKPCPSCGEFISKISGCDQMFCITCGTSFSWKTGNIERGVIHNPHAHHFFQNNPEAREMYLNGINGNNHNGCRAHLPQYYSFSSYLPDDIKITLNYMHRKVAEFRNYYRNNYNQIIENDPLTDGQLNEDLRLRKLRNNITEKHFKSQLHARIKKYNFKKQIYPQIRSAFDIIELFFWELANAQGTIQERKEFCQNIYNSMQELINETNKNINKISLDFGYRANIRLNHYMAGFPLK